MSAAGGSPARSVSLDDIKSVLLLSDVLAVGDNLVAMNIFAHRAGPRTLIVEARLTSEQPLDQELRARLSWGNRALTMLIDPANRAIFDDVPIESLIDVRTGQALADLTLTLDRPALQSE